MFAARLKEARQACGLTLKALGLKIGMAESTISLYESGKREPDLETVHKISNTLSVSTDYLLGRTNDPTLPDSTKDVADEDIKFALFGGDKEITDAQFEEVKRFARYVREREADDK